MPSINIDRLLADMGNPIVYDPVPVSERDQYKYWRGLSLARLALELSQGNRTLQLDGNPAHFADFYTYALNKAQSIARGTTPVQTQPEAAKKIAHMAGSSFETDTPHPALVVAHRNRNPHTFPSDHGMQHGFRIYGGLLDLDGHSQKFIEDYFEIKISS